MLGLSLQGALSDIWSGSLPRCCYSSIDAVLHHEADGLLPDETPSERQRDRLRYSVREEHTSFTPRSACQANSSRRLLRSLPDLSVVETGPVPGPVSQHRLLDSIQLDGRRETRSPLPPRRSEPGREQQNRGLSRSCAGRSTVTRTPLRSRNQIDGKDKETNKPSPPPGPKAASRSAPE